MGIIPVIFLSFVPQYGVRLKARKDQWEALIEGYQKGIFGNVPVQELKDEIQTIANTLKELRAACKRLVRL